jgi:CHASE3 domain sensor protein
MCELQSLFEKKVDSMLAKMFGDQPSDLKTVTKLTLMNTVLTDDMKETLKKIRQKNLEEAEMLKQELEMTLDASGNPIPAIEVLDDENIKLVATDN